MSVQVLRFCGIPSGLVLLLFAAGSVPALAAGSVDQRIYDHAGRLIQEGRPDLALDEYRRLIDSYPRSEFVDDALLAIGVQLYAVSSTDMLGRARGEELEEAYRVFDKIRHEHAQGNAAPEAVMRMAYLRLEPYSPDRDVQQARALFGSVGEVYPDSRWVDESRLGMAFCSRLTGRHAKVIADLQPFWERLGASSKLPEALLWSAEAYEALGRRQRALEIYQRVREEASGTREAKLAEGRLLMLLRRTLAANGVMSLTEDTAFEGLADDLRSVTGVWASPKGWIYVSDAGGGRIVRFDRQGRRLGQRNAIKPALLAFDAYGQAALLEQSSLKVGKQRWDLSTPRGGKKASRLQPAAAPLPRPDANWWFVDERGESVLEFDSSLKFRRVVWQDVNFQIDRARAGTGGGVWLLDVRGGQLVHVDTEGEARAIDLRVEPVSLESPVDLAVDVHGAVWVLDADRKGVAVFSPVGDYEGFVQFQGTRQRAALEAVEVDASGALLVYDGKQRRLRRFQDPPPRSAHTRQAEVKQ